MDRNNQQDMKNYTVILEEKQDLAEGKRNKLQHLDKLYPMTVVIATLGGDSLKSTIEALNQSSVVPEEILICIPVLEAFRVETLPSQYDNVKIFITECRGQVAQRAVGFQNASHEIIMQLDDDLIVEVDCISYLLKTLTTYGPKVSVAPTLMNTLTRIHRNFHFLLI